MNLFENHTDTGINTGFFSGHIPEIFVFGNDLKVDVKTGNLITDGHFMTDQEFSQGAAELNMSVDEYKEWLDYADTQRDLGIDVAYSTEGIDTTNALQDGERGFYETSLAMGNKLTGSEMFEYQTMVMKDDLQKLGLNNEDVAFVKGAEFVKDGKRYVVLPDSNGILRAQDVGNVDTVDYKKAQSNDVLNETVRNGNKYNTNLEFCKGNVEFDNESNTLKLGPKARADLIINRNGNRNSSVSFENKSGDPMEIDLNKVLEDQVNYEEESGLSTNTLWGAIKDIWKKIKKDDYFDYGQRRGSEVGSWWVENGQDYVIDLDNESTNALENFYSYPEDNSQDRNNLVIPTDTENKFNYSIIVTPDEAKLRISPKPGTTQADIDKLLEKYYKYNK